MFTSMCTEGFADRARRELLATGEHARKRNVETRDDLTPQDARIARLARDGLSNAEIGARLFISQSTVASRPRSCSRCGVLAAWRSWPGTELDLAGPCVFAAAVAAKVGADVASAVGMQGESGWSVRGRIVAIAPFH
jgi:DNA-binding CsgD family transcriptional regulator